MNTFLLLLTLDLTCHSAPGATSTLNKASLPFDATGKMSSSESNEDFIKGTILGAGNYCPAEPLIKEMESRNRLKLILQWLESRVNEGSQDVMVHSAIANVYVDTNNNPEHFLKSNEYYDPRDVGIYCEKRDPQLCVVAFTHGQCDQGVERVKCTNTNGSFFCGLCPDETSYDNDEIAEPLGNRDCFKPYTSNGTTGCLDVNECHVGWAGDEYSCNDVDECASDPCTNGGTCTESSCEASAFLDGTLCDAEDQGRPPIGDLCEAQPLADKKGTDTQESVMIFRLQLIAAVVAACVFLTCSSQGTYLTAGILHCPFEGSRPMEQRSPRTLGFKTTNMTSTMCMFGILFLAMQLGRTSAQTCADANVTCNRGSVIVQRGEVPVGSSGSSATGSTAEECCSCPAGTYISYRDENLAFQFSSDGIANTGMNGSLVWNAVVPPGVPPIFFNMTRPNDPLAHAEYGEGMPFSEPRTDVPFDLSPGLFYTSDQDGVSRMAMYMQQKIAIGRANTFFWVATPFHVGWVNTLGGWRPGGAPGSMEFGLGTAGASAQACPDAGPTIHCPWVDSWMPSGYVGPYYTLNRTQIFVFRSVDGMNTFSGLPGPVVDMAVISEPTSEIEFKSTIYAQGLHRQGEGFDMEEEYDIDFRNPEVDGETAFTGGFMSLGQTALMYGEFFQFFGVIHAMECHNTSLTNDEVLDVVGRLMPLVEVNAPPRPLCHQCPLGETMQRRNSYCNDLFSFGIPGGSLHFATLVHGCLTPFCNGHGLQARTIMITIMKLCA
eukprot:SAG22_NODE_482_length_9931_cov_9.247254_3_plen_774_part_00